MAEELTLEQLANIVTDPELEKKVAQSIQLPVGTYNSVPALVRQITKAGPEAKYPGRASARYFGKFNGTGDVTGKTGNAGFRLSWEPRYNDEGKADLSTRLYTQACKVYRQAMNLEDHTQISLTDVLEYLGKYSVAVRFGQGDDDNIAFAISKAKE